MKSLRNRFILAYVGLIIVGFGGLAWIAGRQLSDAARQDYQRQTVNEIQLAAEGMERSLWSYYEGQITVTELDEVLASYEEQTDAELTLYLPEEFRPNTPPEHAYILSEELYQYSEIVGASQGKILFVEREDEAGTLTIYTAAPIFSRRDFLGYIQMSEPASNLNQQISERWAALGVGVLAITFISLIASISLSASLIRPLQKLQNAAVELAKGNLSHRAPPMGAHELNQVASAFNTMANRLEAMLEEQRAFASNTSHELRTPLTTMRLRTEALRYDELLDETTRTTYIHELDDELLRMSSLIDDLILLSRFDAGRAKMGTDLIDFGRFADSLYRTFAVDAAAKSIQLRLIQPEGVSDPIKVQASLNHLTILFRNVLENALKYTPEGGAITWRVQVEGDWVVSMIQDNGQGIDAESLPHVFDRFFRGDKAHSREIPGTGLGLALVKAIAGVYGAKLTVASEGKDKGTTVTIRWQRSL